LIEEFVDVLENMSSLEHKTKIPIEQLPNQLLQKQRHLESIEKKIQEIKLKEQLLLNDYNIKGIQQIEHHSENISTLNRNLKR
jgi:hypothetical protein